MAKPRRGRPAAGPHLTVAALVAAARELVREEGVDRLSMRRLAARLGVDVSSLYWHVTSKEALLDLVADDLLSEARWPDPALPWRERLLGALAEYRRLLLDHRDAARILAGRWVLGRNTLRSLEAMLSALLSAGLDTRAAAQVAFLLNSYVTGFVLQELSPMNSAEAEGADPGEVLARMNATLKALPADEFPSLVTAADDLTARTNDERFERGVTLMLAGLTAL
ncbi:MULTISPECIES: TetR/AcrR family transcriptional regulator [unclassified Nonomuraea]|uniref:TetR/AcrR family transcriptional regulator n=1 Tax=unclassified Nonomuraea TaxID=2593643 RepID=UPI0033CB1371